MFSWSPNLSQISLKKILWESVFSNFGRNENRLFGRHFETVQIFFPPEICLWLVYIYIYGVKIYKKFRWESGFLKGGSMDPLMY